MANVPISLAGYKSNLGGTNPEYAMPVGRGYRARATLPANWNPNVWVFSAWAIASFASTDGKNHTLFEARKDASNYLRVTKTSDSTLKFESAAAGVATSFALDVGASSGRSWAAGAAIFVSIRYGGGLMVLRLNNDTTTSAAPGTFAAGTWYLFAGSNWAHYDNWEGYLNLLVNNLGTQNSDDDRYNSGNAQHVSTWLDTYRAALVLYVGSDGTTAKAATYQGATNVFGPTSATGRLDFVAASSQDVSFGDVTQVDAATKFWILVEVERDIAGVIQILASRWGANNNQRQWQLYLNAVDRIGFEIGDGAGGSWFGTSPANVVPAGTRGMILVRVDLTQATDAARMKIDFALYNGSTRKYGAWSSQTVTFSGSAPAAFITVGSATNMYLARAAGSYFDGKIDALRWATGTTVTDAERDLITVNEPNPFLSGHAYNFDGDANDLIGAINGTVTGAAYVDDSRSDLGRCEKYTKAGQYAFRASGQRIDHGSYAAMDGAASLEVDIIVTPRWKGTEHVYVERGRLGTEGQLTITQHSATQLRVYVPTANTDATTYAECNAFFADYVPTRLRLVFSGAGGDNAARLAIQKSTFDRSTGRWSALSAVTVDTFSGTIPATLRSPSGSPHLMVGDVSGGSTSWASCLFDRLLVHAGTVATATTPYSSVPGARDIWCDYNGGATNAGSSGSSNDGTVSGSAPQWYDGRQPTGWNLSSDYEVDRATNSSKGTYALRILRPSAGGSYIGLKNVTITNGNLGWLGATISETVAATNTSRVRFADATHEPSLDPSGASFARYVSADWLQQTSGAADVRVTNMGSNDELYIDELDVVHFAAVSWDVLALNGLPTYDKPMIGYENWVDANAVYTPTFSGGSWSGSFPLTNLQDRDTSKVARSSSASLANAKLIIDLKRACNVQGFAIAAHNLSLAGLVRITGSANSDGVTSPVYDTDWIEAYSLIYPVGSLPAWHRAYSTRKLTMEDWSDATRKNRYPFYHIAPTYFSARYWCIQFDDTANADGYVELGRLWMTSLYQFDRGFAPGSTQEPIDFTRREIGASGTNFFDKQPRSDKWRLAFDKMGSDEALVFVVDELQRKCGIAEQVLFFQYPWDYEHLHRRSGICVIDKPNPITIQNFSFFDAVLDLVRDN